MIETLKNKKAGMVSFSHIPMDPRVRRAAEVLIEAGMSVDMFCVRDEEEEKKRENFNGIKIRRTKSVKRSETKLGYVFHYGLFFLKSFFFFMKLTFTKRLDLVHVHNMPDALVFCTLIPRLFGAKIILDLHDPSPEVFITKYELSESHYIIRLLSFLERKSIQYADLVFTPNIAFRDLFVSRGSDPDKIKILMNAPVESVFSPALSKATDATEPEKAQFNVMYHGTILKRHGLDMAVEAVCDAREKIPEIQFHVFGAGEFVPDFIEAVESCRYREIVQYFGFKSTVEIARHIEDIDVGIIPNRYSVFTEINFPTRIFEYLAFRKPVIVPRSKGILDYFDESSIFFFDPEDIDSVVDALVKIRKGGPFIEKVIENGYEIYQRHRWQVQKDNMLTQVSALF